MVLRKLANPNASLLPRHYPNTWRLAFSRCLSHSSRPAARALLPTKLPFLLLLCIASQQLGEGGYHTSALTVKWCLLRPCQIIYSQLLNQAGCNGELSPWVPFAEVIRMILGPDMEMGVGSGGTHLQNAFSSGLSSLTLILHMPLSLNTRITLLLGCAEY